MKQIPCSPEKILVLGDSYAYCEDVPDINDRWPTTLLRQITKSTAQCEVLPISPQKNWEREKWVTRVKLDKHEVTTIAQTGRRSDELLKAILHEHEINPLNNYDDRLSVHINH